MSNPHNLEKMFAVEPAITNFVEDIRRMYNLSNRLPVEDLERIKTFLHKHKKRRREILKGTYLDSTDCLTLAVLTHLIAARLGVETSVARPRKVSRYCHALLVYNSEEGPRVFKVSGKSQISDYLVLSEEDIQMRLRYIRPIVNFVNRLKGID